jgi:hypothetical protein
MIEKEIDAAYHSNKPYKNRWFFIKKSLDYCNKIDFRSVCSINWTDF